MFKIYQKKHDLRHMTFILLFSLCFFSTLLNAVEVYCCESEGGVTEYRDSPCQGHLDRQKIIPMQIEPPTAESVREENRVFKNLKKHLDTEEKKQARARARLDKAAKAEQLKEEKLAEKCQKIDDKIKDLESELQMGCTLKQCQRLKRELGKQESKHRQLCQAG